MTPRNCILIDDDRDDQEIFVAAVQDVNPQVKVSVNDNAERMLNELRETANLPDLIFLDINMPKMDGFEFMLNMQRDIRLRKVRVVFYTTTNRPEQIEKANALGATGFITKTNSYAELCDALQKYLAPTTPK
jgi:CheY-like chemotaxis protein